MRILICGDRDWKDYDSIFNFVKSLKEQYGDDLVIIEGEAPGADTMSRKAAEQLNIKVDKYPANWRTFKGSAGKVRNFQMLREGKPDEVHAFHSDLERSKGTKHMVEIATEKGVRTVIHIK